MLLIPFFAFLAVALAAKKGSKPNEVFVTPLGNVTENEVGSVLPAEDEPLAITKPGQCAKAKQLLGVTYEQLKGTKKEPDLTKLSLQWTDGTKLVVYPIMKAAEELSVARAYNMKKPVVIFLHGFTSSPNKKNPQTIVQNLHKIGNYNVLALDASSLVRWMYPRSTTYVRFIGEKLGEVLAALAKKGLKPSTIHLIGHSLGSHMSGFAGKTFYKLTGKKVGRISGLDPAGPCFSEVQADHKLKSTDADFVDVIHSNAGLFGLNQNVGHVDFYPNNGISQPDCTLQTCDHSRSMVYFGESILKSDAFPALACASWEDFQKGNCDKTKIGYMGYFAKPTLRGQFYLQTNGKSPFGKGLAGLKYKKKEGIVSKLRKAVG